MKICLMNMDDRTKQSITLVLKHRTNEMISLGNEAEADVGVLDLDQKGSMEAYREICGRKPSFRAIGLSSTSVVDEAGLVVLQKPISAGRLLEAVQQVSGVDLSTSMVKTASVAASLSERTKPSNRHSERTVMSEANAFFDPRDYLMGALLKAVDQARENKMVAVVKLNSDRVIIVDPQSKMIQTNCSQPRLFSLFETGGKGQGDAPESIEFLTHEMAKSRFGANTYGVPSEQIMWRLGLLTSQGRLPMDVDVEKRLYLRRWPNMTRFPYSDNEMRIVAYWTRQAASLREISEALDIPVQEVCAVYTAAYAAGLVGHARREVDRVWEAPDVSEHKERGLFSSIMKRLIQRKPASDQDSGTGSAAVA